MTQKYPYHVVKLVFYDVVAISKTTTLAHKQEMGRIIPALIYLNFICCYYPLSNNNYGKIVIFVPIEQQSNKTSITSLSTAMHPAVQSEEPPCP